MPHRLSLDKLLDNDEERYKYEELRRLKQRSPKEENDYQFLLNKIKQRNEDWGKSQEQKQASNRT